MISLASGIFDRSQDVLSLEIRIVLQNLVNCGAGAKQIEDIRYTNPHATNARPPAALRIIDRDPTEAIFRHGRPFRL